MKQKILIILSQEIFLRNYLSTNAFRELEKEYILEFSIPSRLSKNKLIDEEKSFLKFNFSQKRAHQYFKILDVLMWRYRTVNYF